MTIDGMRFTILTALAAGPQHGYGILRDITDLDDLGAPPPVGSLYRVLDRLADDGFVRIAAEEVVDGRFRRYYELTDSGSAALADAAAARMRTAREAKARLKRMTATPRRRRALA